MLAKGVQPPLQHVPLDDDGSVQVTFGPTLCLATDVDDETTRRQHRSELCWLYPVDPLSCLRE